VKYLATILVIGVIIASCTEASLGIDNDPKEPEKEHKTAVIGECLYLENEVGDGSYIYTHKGDCPNPIHKCGCNE
jgi:hypothetical protein